MSNPNGQPNDLKGMVRPKRGSNNRHTTFSQRERPPPARYHDLGPWTVTPSTHPPVPQNNAFQPFQPFHLDAANHNPAAAPSTSSLQLPANQPATPTNATLPILGQTQPTNNTETPTNTALPIFGQTQATNNPSPPTNTTSEPTPQQEQTPPPKPLLQPSSPAASITSQNLEDIDLRSPSDDPDYDFIDAAEATHSARNAQPDRADKYPELKKGSKVAPLKQGGVAEGGERKVEAKKKQRGWFSFL